MSNVEGRSGLLNKVQSMEQHAGLDPTWYIVLGTSYNVILLLVSRLLLLLLHLLSPFIFLFPE